jgi:hypothetical protein
MATETQGLDLVMLEKLEIFGDLPGDHGHIGGGIHLRREDAHQGFIAGTANRHVDKGGRSRDLLIVPVPDHDRVALPITRGEGIRTLRRGPSPTRPT